MLPNPRIAEAHTYTHTAYGTQMEISTVACQPEIKQTGFYGGNDSYEDRGST